MSAYSQVDHSGSFVANIILKNGRNEIQIYPISTQIGSLVEDTLVKRFELDTDHKVVCAGWFGDIKAAGTPRKQKRRASDSVANGNGHAHAHSSTNSMLAVCLENGDIMVFSPFRDVATNTISGVGSIVSVSRSSKPNAFWALSKSSTVSEINAENGQVETSLKFRGIDKYVHLVQNSGYRPKKWLSLAVLLALANLYVADGYNPKLVVYQLALNPGNENGKKNIICILPVIDGVFVIVREACDEVFIYDIATKKHDAPIAFASRVGNVHKAVFLDGRVGFLLGEDGAEIVSFEDGAVESTGIVHTNHAEIKIENVFLSTNGIVGVWYDGNQPRFVKIADSLDIKGDISVEVDYRSRTSDLTVSTPEITFMAEDSTDIKNIDPEDLFSQLSALLLEEKVSKKAVIKLCLSNDSEDNIKDTMRQFSASPDCPVLVEKLFLIVSHRVAGDPSKKSSLSIWLRWVLLTHGGYISKQEKLGDNLRELQRNLDDGMKMMPRLLALQGRLQLLKSQAELREKISGNADNAESDESDGDTFNDTFNNTNVEESVVYANGENDDFDSIGANGAE